MKKYYEAHITFTAGTGELETLKESVLGMKWKFSMIDGDANLGAGRKLYATRQYNYTKNDEQDLIARLLESASSLETLGAEILRRKIEVVIYDDRSSLVKPCDGGCVECNLDDIPNVISYGSGSASVVS